MLDRTVPEFSVATCEQLLANGYEPIAVRGKIPVGTAWQSVAIDAEQIVAMIAEHPDAKSIGLRNGRNVGIDLDILDAGHCVQFEALAARVLGPTNMRRVGAKGAMLHYRNDAPLPKIVDIVPEGPPPADPDEGFPIFEPHQFKDRPAPQWIVNGLVREKMAHVDFGLSETFKSFFLCDILASVATGRPAFDHFEVLLPGDAVYCCDEDPDDMMAVRWPAWCIARGLEDPFARPIVGPGRFAIIPKCPVVADPNEVERLVRQIRRRGLKPKLIGIDTLAKAMIGLDQNDAMDIGKLGAVASRLRREFGCAVWFTHHPNKVDKHTMRGSGAIVNDFDVIWESMRAGDTLETKLTCHKLKNAAKPLPQYFRGQMFEVPGAKDQFGRPMRAPVFFHTMAPRKEAEAEPDKIEQREFKASVVKALREMHALGHKEVAARHIAASIIDRKGLKAEEIEARIDSARQRLKRAAEDRVLKNKKTGKTVTVLALLADLVVQDQWGKPLDPLRFALPERYLDMPMVILPGEEEVTATDA